MNVCPRCGYEEEDELTRAVRDDGRTYRDDGGVRIREPEQPSSERVRIQIERDA